MNFKFDLDTFITVLPYIGKGMLGIFIITLVIVAVVYLLNFLTSHKK